MEPAAIVYVTEVMLTPKHRSAMLSLLSPIFYAGVALAYFAAYWLRWRHEAALVSSMAAVGFVAMLVVPETPFWLASNDRAEEAGEALRWLTSDAAYADEELARLRKAAGLGGGGGDTPATASLPRLVLETGAWKPFLLIVAFLFFQQFSGYKVLIFYTVEFYESFGTPVDPYLSAVVFAALVVCTSLALTALLDSFGRRTLMATWAGGVCALGAAAAAHAYAFRGLPRKPLPWLPLACLWLNVVFGTMGLNTLTWIMAGEMFPATVRGPMVSLVWSAAFLLMFASVKIYPASARLLHVHGLLAVFSAVAFAALLCTLVALPETRGKSSQQIESLWLPRRRSGVPPPPVNS